MECRLPHGGGGGGEDATTGDFFYKETLLQTRKRDILWEGRKKTIKLD